MVPQEEGDAGQLGLGESGRRHQGDKEPWEEEAQEGREERRGIRRGERPSSPHLLQKIIPFCPSCAEMVAPSRTPPNTSLEIH